MAAFVGGRAIQIGARLAEILQRGLHRRLIGRKLSGDERESNQENDEQSADDGTAHEVPPSLDRPF
jgi:hypothetical protein